MPSPAALLVRALPAAASGALGLLYPERCVACGRFGRALCAACQAAMEPAMGEGRCPHCSAAWAGPDNCPRCFHMQAVDRSLAAFEMAGAARAAIHGLKYRGVRSLAPTLAAHIRPLRDLAPFDVAFPVPLHRSRRLRRGFNQAELILRALDWPTTPDSLRRSRNTRTQVGLHLSERRANVRGAFHYSGPPLAGQTVALVDDVVTTGATAEECARVLGDHGAASIVVFAFARASHDPAATVVRDA